MTNVERAKRELEIALKWLNEMPQDRVDYYNSIDGGDEYYNAGVVISNVLGHGYIRGILDNFKSWIK